MTQTPSVVSGLLKRHGVKPLRSLSQHFLADPNLTSKITRLADPSLPVIEIGAGTGALTLELARRGHRVLAYEIDLRLKPLLEEVLDGLPNVEVRFADVTEIDLGEVVGEEERWSLVANLPYHVGTRVLLRLLTDVSNVSRYVVMVQREVGERLVAAPGGKQYGIPSVVVQLHAEAAIRIRVPPQVFVPPPAVESVVLTMNRLPAIPEHAGGAVRLASSAFGQRRKMIRTSLAGAVGDVERTLEAAGIDGRLRAADLSPLDYLGLAEASAS